MLDQPILSFIASNVSAPSKNEATSTDSSNTGEGAVPVVDTIEPIESGAAPVEHQFSDVLKETEMKMQTAGKRNAETNLDTPTMLEAVNTEALIVTDHALLAANTPVSAFVVENHDSQQVDTELTVDFLDNSLLLDKIAGMDEATNVAAPRDNIVLDSTLVAPIVSNIQQLIPPVGASQNVPMTSIVESSAKLATIPLVPSSTSAPVNNAELLLNEPALPLVKTPLASAILPDTAKASFVLSNKTSDAQFVQQLSKVFSEQLTVEADADFDADLLKGLGLLNNGPTNTQTLIGDIPKTPIAVTIPFQQAQWGAAVAEKVMWLSSHGLQEAEIQLDPPELGPLQVKVTIENDQAHVSFVVQHANVKEALEQTAMRLREMFEAEGIDLVDVDISDQSAEQQPETELADQPDIDEANVDENAPQAADQAVTSLIENSSGIDAYV